MISLVEKAQAAVQNLKDENLKKIAFEKILESLLYPGSASPSERLVAHTPAMMKPTDNTSLQDTPDNFQEFFNQKNPDSHPNIILTYAYHSHFKGDGDFNVDDVMNAYDKILVPKSKNPTDIINTNIRKGFINKTDGKKNSKQVYHITKDGIDYINNDFQGKTKTIRAHKRKTKDKKVEEIKSD